MTPDPNDRCGAALVVVVLLGLALLGLAHGLLLTAESAYLATRARIVVVELDARVSGLLERERVRPWPASADSMPIGARSVEGDTITDSIRGALVTEVARRRLGREVWWVGAEVGRGESRPIRGARLLWRYDPATRVAGLPAVVSTGSGAPVVLSGTLTSDGGGSLGTVHAPALGLLDLPELLARSAPVAAAFGSPAPVERGGACDAEEPWSWGDPERPWRPCGGHFVAMGSAGSFTLESGVGQGLLVVDGDLSVQSGTRFEGVIVSSGRVEITQGSTVVGRIVAFGGLTLDATSGIEGSAAHAERALEAVRAALGRPVPMHPAARLGPG